MNKKNIVIVGIIALIVVLGFGSVVYGVSSGEEVMQAINNYFYGETTVQQDVSTGRNIDTIKTDDEKMGISDQSGGFVVTKKITNSDIATTSNVAGIDLTNAISGALVVNEIIISTDSSGLSTSTPGGPQCSGIIINAERSSASTTIMQITSLASLTRLETMDFTRASSSVKTRLEDGSNLQIMPIDTACRGSGITTFTMFFDRVDERSHIYE